VWGIKRLTQMQEMIPCPIKRDLYQSTETYMNQKRPIPIKRDLQCGVYNDFLKCRIWFAARHFVDHVIRHDQEHHISLSHVTCQWVMSHINESCHMSMSHDTHQCA